jgi:hypothetical protein
VEAKITAAIINLILWSDWVILVVMAEGYLVSVHLGA